MMLTGPFSEADRRRKAHGVVAAIEVTEEYAEALVALLCILHGVAPERFQHESGGRWDRAIKRDTVARNLAVVQADEYDCRALMRDSDDWKEYEKSIRAELQKEEWRARRHLVTLYLAQSLLFFDVLEWIYHDILLKMTDPQLRTWRGDLGDLLVHDQIASHVLDAVHTVLGVG